MGWFSARWKCQNEECGSIFDETVASELRDIALDCPDCGLQSAVRIPFASVLTSKTAKSYLDGNNRFGEIKERRKLERAERAARNAGDADTRAEIKKELTRFVMGPKK